MLICEPEPQNQSYVAGVYLGLGIVWILSILIPIPSFDSNVIK